MTYTANYIRQSLGAGPSYYLDIGCGHPSHKNETIALARAGWTGISIDKNPEWIERYKTQRKDHIAIHADALDVDYVSLLTEHNAPLTIGFLSVNIQPDTRANDLLRLIPFSTFKFMIVANTHNCQHKSIDEREEARQILDDRGDRRVDTYGPLLDSTDLYVHPQVR